ncbi:hypothetical protein JCM19046_3488 [Bacillus sp. JCM 19046]|nr:hypothetical protein JCM19045_4378 [Bacillus sp. JCM 19045]GAF18879.1 hypothetical protein JCM19046_3488 [Bacillus sp. JCM 19046]
MPKQPFFPQLETDRLRLRALTDDDAVFIFKLFSNEKVCAFLYDEEVYTSMDDAREFIEWHAEPEKKGGIVGELNERRMACYLGPVGLIRGIATITLRKSAMICGLSIGERAI